MSSIKIRFHDRLKFERIYQKRSLTPNENNDIRNICKSIKILTESFILTLFSYRFCLSIDFFKFC